MSELPPVSITFNFVIEALASRVHQNAQTEGIKTASYTYKILLYADDIVFTLQNPLVSLIELKNELCKFGEVSGYRINEKKSALHGMNISREKRKI